MSELLSKSKNFTEEYCCSVVRVGELTPVENSDRLMKTLINGETIVVNKAEVHEGDIMLYVSNECQIGAWFLAANNLYQHYELNSNRELVEQFIKQNPDFEKTEEMKSLRGYFGDNGRVRMIRLRGCPSFGVLFKPEAMERAMPNLKGHVWDVFVGTDFDTVNDQLFVCAYVPPRRNSVRQAHGMKGVARWDRLDRMVPGQFKLHYDTAPLKKHIALFNRETCITATVKMHGTSFICGNVLVNTPLRWFKVRRWLNHWLHLGIPETRQEYGMVVSSRKVIKNEWGNSEHPEGFYGKDIWTEYANIIFPYIPKGYTVYGEICGYITGESTMIQKGYDYGCAPGTNFLMPYRVTQKTPDGMRELSIEEVGRFTAMMKARMFDSGDHGNLERIFDIRKVSVFGGNVAGIIGDRDITELSEALAQQGHIEEDEPLCRNKVPREGVVVRIEGDEIPEAFKLKSLRFLEHEKAAIDKGEVDMEMQQTES